MCIGFYKVYCKCWDSCTQCLHASCVSGDFSWLDIISFTGCECFDMHAYECSMGNYKFKGLKLMQSCLDTFVHIFIINYVPHKWI